MRQVNIMFIQKENHDQSIRKQFLAILGKHTQSQATKIIKKKENQSCNKENKQKHTRTSAYHARSESYSISRHIPFVISVFFSTAIELLPASVSQNEKEQRYVRRSMIPKPEKGKQTSSLSEIYAHLKCRKMPLEIHKSYRRGWGGTYLKYYTFDPCEPSGADIFCRY